MSTWTDESCSHHVDGCVHKRGLQRGNILPDCIVRKKKSKLNDESAMVWVKVSCNERSSIVILQSIQNAPKNLNILGNHLNTFMSTDFPDGNDLMHIATMS